MASTPSPPNSAPQQRGDKWLLGLFALLLLAVLLNFTRRWDASILDRYEFRQLQTALSIHWMKEEGLRLDYLTPLFGPPWTIPMEFPTYQACAALASQATGLSTESAARLVSVLFYLAALPAGYLLLGLAGLSPSRRLLALAIVLTSPVYLFYPRTVMIETAALCLSLWSVWLLHHALATRRPLWWFAATLVAALAALTKITTYVVYCVPAAAVAWAHLRRRWHQSPRPATLLPDLALAALPVGFALALTLTWVAHGDALKAANPFAGFLSSAALRDWNYGPLSLRLDPAFWFQLLQNVTQNVASQGALAVGLVFATFAPSRARWIAAVALGGFLAGPLVFANLYHVHDYYYTANAFLLTGAIGLLLAAAWDHPSLTRATRVTGLVTLLVLQLHAFDRGYHYYFWKPAPPPPGLAAVLREVVAPDDVILISGDDWNPLLAYYSERRTVMVAGGRDQETAVLDDVLARLPPRRIAAMVLVGDKVRPDPDLLRTRVARLGLDPRPFATGPNADLYLPADAISGAAHHLHGRSGAAHHLHGREFGDARVLVSATAPLPMDPVVHQVLAPEDYRMCVPAPQEARSQFGVNPGTEAGLPVIYAHAPSELYLVPPPGSRHLNALVGLAASAYAKPPPEASDGIVVEIFEEQPGGLRRSLHRRALTPATTPGDRGPQSIEIDNGRPFTGRLIFTLSPGPRGNLSYDQAWWSAIRLR